MGINVINGVENKVVKNFDCKVVLYIPSELGVNVYMLPKVENLTYIETSQEEHPKDFIGKVVMVFFNTDLTDELVCAYNIIVKLIEIEIDRLRCD